MDMVCEKLRTNAYRKRKDTVEFCVEESEVAQLASGSVTWFTSTQSVCKRWGQVSIQRQIPPLRPPTHVRRPSVAQLRRCDSGYSYWALSTSRCL